MHSRAGSISGAAGGPAPTTSNPHLGSSTSTSTSTATSTSSQISHQATGFPAMLSSGSAEPGNGRSGHSGHLPASVYDEKPTLHHHPAPTPASPSRSSTPLRASTREKDKDRDRDRDRHGEKGLTPTINLALPVFNFGSSRQTGPSWSNGGLERGGSNGGIGLGIGGNGLGNGLSAGGVWNNREVRPRLVILISAMLVFYLGYITGAGSPTPSRLSSLSPSSSSSKGYFSRGKNKIPFLLKPAQLPPPSQPPDFAVTADRKVPPYVHYVFGLSPDFGGKPFGFLQYAAIQSALQILHPEKIYFHYVYEPKGWWWERQLEVEGFTPVKAREVDEIFGRPIEHFAHKADVIRLEALRDLGGIYLDTDVFIVRNFDPLLSSDVVMAEEAQPSLRPTDPPSGLCNAVIVARPYAPFVMRWIESYRSFDKGLWATHSVAKPWELAKMHPNEITVLDRHAFFYPLWHEDHVDLVHNTMDWDFDRSGQYCYHAWESLTWYPHLQALDPDRIHVWGEGETSFTRFVRRYVHEPIRNRWREAHARGEV